MSSRSSRKLGPIVGMPADTDRPRCPWCRGKLRPRFVWNDTWTTLEQRNQPPQPRQFTGWDSYGRTPEDGMFCTLRCARAFAHAAYRAGYRRMETKDAIKDMADEGRKEQ